MNHPSPPENPQPPESQARRTTFLLAVLSAVTLLIVRWDSAWLPWWTVVQPLVATGLAVAVGWGPARSWSRSPVTARERGRLALLLGLAVLLPFPLEALRRGLGDAGDAPELVMLLLVQNVVLVLSVVHPGGRARSISFLLGGFLVLFSVAMTQQVAAYLAAGLHALLSLWWLMAAHWERLVHSFPASRTRRVAPPRAAALLATALCVGVLVSLGIAAGPRSMLALHGFMPTSGGQSWSLEQARSGIGDGDMLVGAQDQAMSFGPVESELFLDSEMPSLYDMFDDTYGEPWIPKRQERSIGLAYQERNNESEQKVAQTKRSGREFSAVRRGADGPRKELQDRDAPALLYVQGPTPLHLALETYDRFDGRSWFHSGTPRFVSHVHLETVGERPWMRVASHAPNPLLFGQLRHALRIINLKTARIPSPPQLSALHIDKLDRPDFFGWTEDGVLQMVEREQIPQLTVLHLRSRGMDLDALRGQGDFRPGLPRIRTTPSAPETSPEASSGASPDSYVGRLAAELELYFELPESVQGTTRSAAERFRELPAGWQQVEAVVDWLREEFEHDPRAVAEANCGNVVEHFLSARRGPDYLFATTAATLLRELGYPTRLVSGLYARPERYDRQAGQTTVLPDDVHVWVEVRVDSRHWIPVEPTPGYAPPRETHPWWRQAWRVVAASGAWVVDHASLVAGAGLLVVLALLSRVVWLDLAGLALWWLLGRGSSRQRLAWTLWLLEWRSWLAGHARPPGVTVNRWYARLRDASGPAARGGAPGRQALASGTLASGTLAGGTLASGTLAGGTLAETHLTDAAGADTSEGAGTVFLRAVERLLYSSDASRGLDHGELARACWNVSRHWNRQRIRQVLSNHP